MRKLKDLLYVASSINSFKKWKYYLRHHDVTCDVVNSLDGIPQSTFYHPEFDALLHTYYVCRAIFNMDRHDLLEAAFLHDVGKAKTTNIGHKRIYHFGHPKKSVEFIEKNKYKIEHYDLTRRITEEHMNLPLGHKKLETDIDLHDFVIADKIISKQLYLYKSDWFNRFKNKTKEKIVKFKQNHSCRKVYIMVGIQGSGKSRYLKNIDSKYIVSPDLIREELTGNVSDQSMNNKIWIITKSIMKVVLCRYGKVYLDATNVNKWLRIEFMAGFNNVQKIAVVFDVDPDVAYERIQNDIKNNVNRADVPRDVVYKYYKLFIKSKKSLKNEFNKVIYIK